MTGEPRPPRALTRRYHVDLCLLAGCLCTGALRDGPALR